jgi:hypothetical protein
MPSFSSKPRMRTSNEAENGESEADEYRRLDALKIPDIAAYVKEEECHAAAHSPAHRCASY